MCKTAVCGLDLAEPVCVPFPPCQTASAADTTAAAPRILDAPSAASAYVSVDSTVDDGSDFWGGVFHLHAPSCQGRGLSAVIDVVVLSCSRCKIFNFLYEGNSSPTLQCSRRMPFLPRIQKVKVWLLPWPIGLPLQLSRVIHRLYVVFNRDIHFIFFPSFFSPIYNTTALPTIHNLPCLGFVSFFQFLLAVHQHLPPHRPVRKDTPDKTHTFCDTCYKYM